MQEASWRPITPLGPITYHEIDASLARLDALHSTWNQIKTSYPDDIVTQILGQLNRNIAVETGIIEGLYDLDRGLTQTLVTHGFTRDTVDRAGESVAETILSMLRDHARSLDYIMDYIGDIQHDLTPAYIRELHALVTASQTTYKAWSRFGGQIEIELNHGVYKTQPNNPSLPGGGIHEYAPVEQVASQMDELVRLFGEIDEGQHAVAKAAWLHHRFVQIHPFQDGNGRVARLLASMVLIKANYFPLHIRREDRKDYLEALEAADAGRLEPFVNLVSRRMHDDIQRTVSDASKAVRGQAPSTGDGASHTKSIAAHLAARRRQHQAEELEQRRQVNHTAEALLPHIAGAIETRLREAQHEFELQDVYFRWRVDSGGAHDDRGYWWWHQIVQTARRLDYWANRSEKKYWIRSDLTLDEARLRMVVSLHHYGWPVSGIMAVSAFVQVPHRPSEEDAADRTRIDQELEPCINQVFTFTKADAGDQLQSGLDAWIDETLAITLRILDNAAG